MIKFKLNGKEIIASKDETICVAVKNNVDIPHLCRTDEVGYDPDGEIVEPVSVQINDERTL